MNGYVHKRSGWWRVTLDFGWSPALRCPACLARKGRNRGRLLWLENGHHEVCPDCGGPLEEVMARRKILLEERYRLKEEARDRLTSELNAGLAGIFTEPAKITLGEYLEDWLKAIAGTIRPGSLHLYTTWVRQRITPGVGHIRLQKLTTRDIDAFYARLVTVPAGPRKRVLQPASVRSIHRCLHRALTKAIEWRLISANPADATEKPRVSRPEMVTWTEEELAVFLKLTEGDRLGPLWRFLSMTGARRGEALGLRWSEVDLEAGRVTVRRSRVQVGYEAQEQADTKTSRSHVIAIGAGTVAALQRQAAQQAADAGDWGDAWQGDGHLFTREDGAPWQPDRISKLFDQAVKASGLERIPLKNPRHTHASIALAAAIHPKVVSERLGHATVSMTLDTYSHIIPVLQESAAELIEARVDAR